MRLLYVILFLFLSVFANSQKLLKGIVVDAEKNIALVNASVFLNTTATGTITNAQGNFSLTLPGGRHELVVSMIGYETFAQIISTTDAADFITIKLKIRMKELETVVIEPYEKDGWQKWGGFFLESFIGTSAYSKNCKIKNIEVIKFRLSKNGKELAAFASEPLIIQNEDLGYTLRYQLETFQFDFNTRYLIYAGYPFFQPMKGSLAKQRRWDRNRRDVFEGSIMHFMRAIYRNNVAEEGFEIRALQKNPNTEKQRVKAAYSPNTRREKFPDGRVRTVTINKDTAKYYNRIMRQPDYTNIVGEDLLTADCIAYGVNSTTAGLDFKNYLLVMYNKAVPAEFRRQFPQAGTSMMSGITLINERAIEIQANGSYFSPVDFMSTGYWAWSEKIATSLPFDYISPK